MVPDALHVRKTILYCRKPLAFEQVRRVHGVLAGAQFLGERAHSISESLHVVEQHNFGHLSTSLFSDDTPKVMGESY